MITPYNEEYDQHNPNTLNDICGWPSLHSFGELGRVVAAADASRIVSCCDHLLTNYLDYQGSGFAGLKFKGDSAGAFERHADLVTPETRATIAEALGVVVAMNASAAVAYSGRVMDAFSAFSAVEVRKAGFRHADPGSNGAPSFDVV
jgi:hypothetical protein